MKRKIYSAIASKLQAIFNCKKRTPVNAEWSQRHTENIERLVKDTAPSGSGIDCGTKFDFQSSNQNRLVFSMSFHHMDENGYYSGWSDYQIIVTPDLASGFNIRITGHDRDQIKEYLYDVYSSWLNEETEF